MPAGTQIASLYATVGADVSGLTKGLGQAQGKLKKFAGVVASGLGMAGLATAAVGIGKAMIGTAKSFESSMNVLTVAARSSGASMNELKDAAIAVGGDTRLVGISAAQAAISMTEFYKAGLSTSDILGNLNAYMEDGAELSGAMRAAVDLQAASELDLAQASEVVSVAMATFNKTAEDAPEIANNLVKAADASVASVGELAAALTNVGPTAAAFGWGMEDVNTALALLSQRGIKGAEAGTALKSMMTNIMRPTDKTAAALQDLNVSLYDAAGTMYELPEIMAQLEEGLAGVSDEQRNQYVQTLAGTYGMKAMNTLLAEGAEGWGDMEEAIAAAASAQETAEARTSGLEGALETLSGVWETLMIQVGLPFIEKVATPFVRALGDMVEGLTKLDDTKASQFFRDLKTVMFGATVEAKTAEQTFKELGVTTLTAVGGGKGVSEFPLVKLFSGAAEKANVAAEAIRRVNEAAMAIDDVAMAESLINAWGGSAVTQEQVDARLQELMTVQERAQAEVAARWEAWGTAFTAQQAEMWGKLGPIAEEGLNALFELQTQWSKDSLAGFDEHTTALLEATDQESLARLTKEQDLTMKLAEIDATFRAKMEAAIAAGDAKEFAKLQEKYATKIAGAQNQYAKEGALSDRARLVEQAQQERARIIELQQLAQHYNDKMGMMLTEAYAEQGLTDRQITARLHAMGLALSAEARLAVAHGQLNAEKLKNDQDYAKGFVKTLQSMIDAEIAVRQQSLEGAKSALEAWKPPDIKLPQIGTGLGQGGIGDLGGLGDLVPPPADIIEPIRKKTVTVVEAVEDTVGKMAKAIKSAIEALTDVSKYTGFADLATPLGNLVTDISAAMDAFNNLPILDMEDKIAPSLRVWADRLQAIASIIGGANKAVEALKNQASLFKAGAAASLEDLRDALIEGFIPTIRGIHAAFKELPIIKAEEIGVSLKLWGQRMSAISSILGAANKVSKLLAEQSTVFKSGAAASLEDLRVAVVEGIIPIVRGIHAAFKELPVIAAEEIGESFGEWSERFKGIAGILDGVNKSVDLLVNKPKEMRSGAGKGLAAVRDAIIANVIPVIRGIMAAMKTLPTLIPKDNEITASMAEWDKRMGSISSILENSIGSVTKIVEARATLRFVATHMGAFRAAIADELAPAILAITEELNKALPDEVVGAAKFEKWAIGLESIMAVIEQATGVITKLEELRGKSPATIGGLVAHFGDLFNSLNTGFEGMDWAAPPGAGVSGPGGRAPIQVDVHDNQLIGTTDEAMKQIATAVAAIIMTQLEAGEGVGIA